MAFWMNDALISFICYPIIPCQEEQKILSSESKHEFG